MQKKQVFVNPLIDIVFKTLWLRADNDLKDYFDRLLKYVLRRDFSEYSIGPNETGVTNIKNIANKVDILLVCGDEKVDIEMNNTREKNGIKAIEQVVNKSLVYLSYYITTYYDNDALEDHYKRPIKIDQINLNTFHCPQGYQLERLDYKFTDITNSISKEGIEYHHIYLPRFYEIWYSSKEVSDIYKDFAMLMCKSYEEMEQIAGTDKGRLAVIKMLKKLGSDDKFMDILNRREDEMNIFAEASKEETKTEMILRLKDKVSLEDLAAAASMTVEEVKSIIESSKE